MTLTEIDKKLISSDSVQVHATSFSKIFKLSMEEKEEEVKRSRIEKAF